MCAVKKRIDSLANLTNVRVDQRVNQYIELRADQYVELLVD